MDDVIIFIQANYLIYIYTIIRTKNGTKNIFCCL